MILALPFARNTFTVELPIDRSSALNDIFSDLTMTPLASRSVTLRGAATRVVARRQMSTAPKLHKAKAEWAEFEAQRPPQDHLDTHVRSSGA
jgi:hypothetical protein